MPLRQPYISKTNDQKKKSFQNGGQKMNFRFAKKVTWPKFEKNTFPKEFFDGIWLKVEEHEYIYIVEIKFEKKNIPLKNGGQNTFWDIAPIYTN